MSALYLPSQKTLKKNCNGCVASTPSAVENYDLSMKTALCEKETENYVFSERLFQFCSILRNASLRLYIRRM